MDSPCIASCKLNADKICIGCYRHIEEIVDWNKRSDAEHAAIYQKLAERKLQLANMPADSTSAITQAEWQQAKAAIALKKQSQLS
ncbi:DUF1289 domain-containing protein [Rheinheimera sp.]|uniref:DUF1289 domain-containing protein n=1 Tax=Rheinheimera sp. TaxID=1869214 RepID=UPI0027BA9035|nr:DUF1289 domain-containing protein [Rheinheimera sp.]